MLNGTNLDLAKTWRVRIVYPLLMFILLESTLYIVVRGYQLPGQLLPFTVIIIMALAITQIRMISGVFVSNILVGLLTILYFIHQRYYPLEKLLDINWLGLLYEQLKLTVHAVRSDGFAYMGELGLTCLLMPSVWFYTYLVHKSLVCKGKIIGVMALGFIVQGLMFSYVVRTTNFAHVCFMLAGLILLSMVRLSKLQIIWYKRSMFGAEELGFNWTMWACVLILCVVLVSAVVPASSFRVKLENSRLQAIANLFAGSRPTQGNTQGPGASEVGDVGSSGNTNNSFSLANVPLGGPWFGSSALVMSVTSSRPAYWRGGSKDNYDGKQWTNTNNQQSASGEHYTGITTERVEQVIRLGGSFSSPVAFGATMPVEVNGLSAPYSFDTGGAIVLAPQDAKNVPAYTVLSQVPVLDQNSLNALRKSGSNYPPEVVARYLQLPSIPLRVKDLALRITEGKDNPYDKALALQDYLQSNQDLTYDLKPAPTPPDRDFVDFFLFDGKKGYCTYFSTAMAVMARCAGLPSRWVIGYSSGVANEKTPDVYRVNEMNKHAWVEIYFSGVGWIPFEPTQTFTLPASLEQNEPVQKTPEAEKSSEAKPTVENSRQLAWGSLAVGAVGLIVGLMFILKRKKQKGATNPSSFLKRRQSARRVIFACYLAFLKLMQIRGKPRHASQTPREFARALQQDTPDGHISTLTEVFEQARYSPWNPGEWQVELAQTELEAIKQQGMNKHEQKGINF